jgi:hypothetical protein
MHLAGRTVYRGQVGHARSPGDAGTTDRLTLSIARDGGQADAPRLIGAIDSVGSVRVVSLTARTVSAESAGGRPRFHRKSRMPPKNHSEANRATAPIATVATLRRKRVPRRRLLER